MIKYLLFLFLEWRIALETIISSSYFTVLHSNRSCRIINCYFFWDINLSATISVQFLLISVQIFSMSFSSFVPINTLPPDKFLILLTPIFILQGSNVVFMLVLVWSLLCSFFGLIITLKVDLFIFSNFLSVDAEVTTAV